MIVTTEKLFKAAYGKYAIALTTSTTWSRQWIVPGQP